MSAANRLLNEINTKNPHKKDLTVADVIFGLPIVLADHEDNTKISMTAKAGTGYRGTVELTYNRLHLNQLQSQDGIMSEVPFTKENIASALNETVDPLLTENDLNDLAIPVMVPGDLYTVSLQASNESMGWIGNVDVELLFGIPTNIFEIETLMQVTLPSIGYLSA